MTGKVWVIILLSLSLLLGIAGLSARQPATQGEDAHMVEQLMEVLQCSKEQAQDIADTLKECDIHRVDSMTLTTNERGYLFLTLQSGSDVYQAGIRPDFFVEEVRKKGTPKDSILYQIIY